MGDLYDDASKPISLYKDRRYAGGMEEREQLLRRSKTLYVGNLSFYTNEEQVYELFSRAGEIRRIVMGLDRLRKTPCGFCFVEYYTRRAAENSVNFLSGSKLDERVIRVDYDAGFVAGRQFGRGKSGGQVRDEYRTDFDPGRGGYGKASGLTGMQLWGGDGERARGRGRGRGRGRARGRRPWDGRPMKRRRDSEDDGREPRSKAPRIDDERQAPSEQAERTRNARFERGKDLEMDAE